MCTIRYSRRETHRADGCSANEIQRRRAEELSRARWAGSGPYRRTARPGSQASVEARLRDGCRLQDCGCTELGDCRRWGRLCVGTELMVHISTGAVGPVQDIGQMQHPTGIVRMVAVLAPIWMHRGVGRRERSRNRSVAGIEMRVANAVQHPGRLSRQQTQHHPRSKPVQRAARLQSTQRFGQRVHGGSLAAWP